MTRPQDPQSATQRAGATIYDVARTAGVSPSTVSRALGKQGRINARTVERIRHAADSLGYRVNAAARALPTGKTSTVALVVSDAANPVFFSLVRGAEKRAALSGYTLVFAESRESSTVEFATVEALQPSVDGILLLASRMSDTEITDLSIQKPVVVANREVAGIPSLTPDVEAGLSEAIAHLAKLGHESVAYLTTAIPSWMSLRRWQVVQSETKRSGLTARAIRVLSPTEEQGANALDLINETDATAVLAYNDLLALGLLRACREAGVSVPGELSIVGFDDVFGADLTTPGLTTIRTPLAELGEASMSALLDEIDQRSQLARSPVQTRLIVRGSTSEPGARNPSHQLRLRQT